MESAMLNGSVNASGFSMKIKIEIDHAYVLLVTITYEKFVKKFACTSV